jgi:hypothetical protein
LGVVVNVIEFSQERIAAGSGELHDLVNIYIDGRPLAAIMREIEFEMAKREGHPDLAGEYSPFINSKAAEDHYLGRHAEKWGESKSKTALLECECGCPGCWPLLCKIEIGKDEVKWKEFEQPHRGPNSAESFWDYSSFDGFTFSKDQYLGALAALAMTPDASVERTREG